jgi:uncharacterized repeat protein (TIGR02543 family)
LIGALAADVNGDGKMEIVVTGGTSPGADDGLVTALDGSTGNVVWQVAPGGVGQKTPIDIADIDGDGSLEIVVYGNYPVVLHGDDGSIYWKNTAVSSYNDWGAICDIDADGHSEIFVSSGRGPSQGYDYFTMLSYDGKILLQNPTSWHPCWGGITIGDPNSDGNFILYQGDRNYGYRTSPSPEEPYIHGEWGLRALDAATLTPLWNYSDILCSSHTPILADVDKDGFLDVIATSQGTGNGGLIVVNASNGVVSTAGGKYRKSTSLGLPSHSPPTVYDIDGDGNLEIITCRYTNPKIWDLYDWKLDATLPIVCYEPPKVGDVNGDGAMEIIAPSGNSIYIYDKNFNQVEVITGLNDPRPFTLVQDVDGDGNNELIVTSTPGIVYCYDTPAPAPTPRVRSELAFYSERHCGAAEYVPPRAPLAPVISQPNPSDKATNVPVALSQLKFNLSDYQQDLVDYTVTTSPDIGSGSGTGKTRGQYSIPVSNLNYATTYFWTVVATDGSNPRTKTFTFTTESMPPWWNTAWPYRRTISVDHTKVSGDQTNFPVVIDITDSGLAGKAQLDGDDFVFTDANQVKLSYEIENYYPGTGHLIAWVKIPFLSSSVDTSILMYYGNPTCGSQQDPTAVWDTNNMLVLHLDETHECRLWGMIADAVPHDVVVSQLINASASLKKLGGGPAGSNDDGWGLVYYNSPTPVVARGFPPAYTDPNFDLAANALANSGAWIGVGHVRARSQGGLPPWGDPHPFMRYKGGKWWAFAHNGNVNKNILRSLIGTAYLAANPPTYGASWDDDANVVDSDLYALFVLKCIEANNWNVTVGVAQAIKDLTDAGDNGAANFILTNGVTLWGFRRGNTLYYKYQSTSPQYSTIASQPSNTSESGWVQLSSDYNFVTIERNSPPSVITDIRQYYPTPILVDSEFTSSADSADLRNNSTSQDWYESRNNVPTLLFLDTNSIGGNTGKKAGFTASSSGNAYLTQEFSAAQTGRFSVQWDVYIDSILDISGTDRAGWMMIGDDFDGASGPNQPANERFVYMAFYKNGGGTSGTMDLVAKNSTDAFTANATIASGLSLKQWYTIRVVCNVPAKTYDVYVDGVFVATVSSAFARTSVTHISFAQWNDGAGAFFVDNVYAPAKNRYKLAINSVGNGSVNMNPGESSYLPATVVTLTATPAQNWYFSGWSGDLTGDENPETITIDTNKAVTATFTSQGYTLSVDIVGGGSVSQDPDLASYPDGSVVTLTATPTIGWSFSGWSGALSGSSNPATLTMDGDKVVVATFTQNQYTLTVNVVGNGQVTKTPYKTTYTYGETITLTASGDPSWLFSKWSGDLTGSANPATITIDGDKVVTATFIQGYVLSVNIIGGGSVSRDPDQASYVHGSVVTLTATPTVGWSFSGWSGALSGSSNPATLTMDGDKVVVATFTQNQYTLTVNIVGSGQVTKNPNKATYTYGETVTLTAIADPGWAFSEFSCGCDNPFTMTVDGDKVVTATFTQVYTLTIGIVGSGSVAKDPDQPNYLPDSLVTLTATPAIGWSFSGWSGALSGSSNPATLTMDGDKVVVATFTQNQYTLTINIVGSGQVTKTPDKTTYTHGEIVTLKASPIAGWSFFRWSGDLIGSTNPTTITMDGNKVVTVTFVQGTVCFDSTLNGNNGALYGGVTQGIAGKIDGAYAFDGTTGYIQVPHSNTLSGFTQALTVSFWLRLDDVSKRQTLLCKNNAGTSTKSWYIEFWNHATYGKNLFFYASQDGSNSKEWFCSFVPTAGTWYYVTVVWQTNTVPKFYINGAQVTTRGTSTTVASIYNNVNVPLYIGRCPYDATRYLKGGLDEIRISNSTRTAGWILTSYNSQKDPSTFYRVGTEESLPPAPLVFDPNPANGATNVPVTTTELSFSLADYQNDLMNYDVSTTPNIGGGSATGVHNGRYSAPISGLQYSTTYTWYVHVTDGTHQTDATYTFTTSPRWLVDSELSDSIDSADLKLNGAGQDWYESRNDVPTLLFLDTSNVGGDTSKKAGFTASSSGNAYLTQDFGTAQTGTFSVQWDIYVDSILDISSPDRAGFMLLGRDLDGQKGPSSTDSERFVFLAFFKNGGGTTGTMDLVAMSSFSAYTTVASGLNMKQWYTIKVIVNVPAGTYDIYVDGALKATKSATTKLTSITHISFAQWNDGAGAFYVDNVLSPAQDRYRLTLIAAGSGSIANSPAEATYRSGTTVTLTATPASEWYFDRWSGGVSGNANPTTIKMDSDKVVTAIFTQECSLTVDVVGSGSVARNPNQASYTPGTVVTLTATPALGWSFIGWSGDLTGNTNPATITMNSSKIVTATFTQKQYALAINIVGSGAVTKNPDQATYAEGTVVTLTAAPVTGWSFSSWTGDLTGSTNPATITMTSDKVVTATFTQDQYTLTVNVDGGGSVAKTPDQPTYTYGTSVQLAATPEPGYAFSHWTGDLSGSLNPDSIILTGNKAVTAVFIWTQTNWWNNAWQYRRTITIDHLKVSSDQTDFPVLVDLTDSGLTLKAQTDGDDFVFTDANQAKLSHEIELYESGTGHLVAWIKIPLLSSTTDTVLYMYYGNPSSANQQDTTAVWDTSNKLILHLDEKTGTHYDSTVNGNNGTPYNGVIQGASGKIDGADTFDGSNDYVQVAHSNTLSGFTQGLTVSFWLRLDDVSKRQTLLCKNNAGTNVKSWYIEFWNHATYGKNLFFYASQDGSTSKEWFCSFVPTAGTWYYVTVVWQTNTVPKFYINGAQVTTRGTSTTVASIYNNVGVPLYIGRCPYDSTRYLKGSLDEIRISNPVRSASWILTCYNSQNNPSTFYQVGTEEQLEAPRYTLTITTVGQGSVTKDPSQITYPKDTVVQLTANAVPGWTFASWSGDLTGSTNPISITMTGNKAVTATFTQDQYTLTLTVVGNGQINKSPDQTTYTYGTVVTLTAAPSAGWSFTAWSGDLIGSTDPTTITMTGNKAVTATFTQLEYTLTVTASPSEGGSVTVTPAGPYHYGDNVQLEAFPATDWYFAGWSGDLSGLTNPTAITIDGNKAVTATFVKVGFTLTINVVGSGSVTISPQQPTYDPGTVVSLTAIPASGWSFSAWSGDLTGNTNPGSVTMDGNKVITATFTEDQYTLDVTLIGNGQVTKNPLQATYTYGTIVMLTATADTGWTFSGWSGDLSGTTNPTTITMDGNKVVTATFTANQYTLTVTIVGSGSVSQSPDPPYYYGNVVTLTATPQASWLFSQWSGALTGSTNPTTITMDGNKVVTATFIRLLVDSEFLDSVDSDALRANGAGQDWYDSRAQAPTLLYLDESNVGGNAGKKAGFTASTSGNVYLSQEFISPQTGTFSVQWDIYVDSIIDISGTDATAFMMIGDDSTPSSPGPNYPTAERFVYMAFYKNGGGTSGTMALVCRQRGTDTLTTIATLNMDQWYTIRVVVHVDGGNYEVYVDGALMGTYTSRNAKTSVTHISFAQWNDGAGAFYVDNVHSPALDRYKLTVSTVGSGSVTKTPGESTYTAGSVVTLTATPATGWSFSAWSGDFSGSVSPATVTMDSNKMITATFTQNQYTLAVDVAGSGTVAKSPDKTFYTEGETVNLEAVPSAGWSFTAWSGDLSGSTNPTTITMSGNKVVTATFTQLEYTLTATASPSEGGSVTVSPLGPYHYGDLVQLTAVPATDWSFSGWGGDLTGSENPATITITQNTAITAYFSQNERTLTIDIVGNGHVTKNPDKATYPDGTVVSLTATADPGWTFAGWSGDLSGSINPTSITMTGNKGVTATFTQNEYTLTVNIVGSGSVTRNPDQLTYHYNDVVQLTAKAADGWIFSGWSGDVSGSTNPDSVTIDVDPSVTATFTQHQYTLTVIVVGNGVVNKVPDEASYASGTVVQLTAVPDAGWSFSGWSGALSGSVNPESITMDSDKSVTATFTANQYTLTVTIVGSGLVSQSPDPPYTYGTVVTLTATPQAGWLFSQWSGDLTGSTNPATITITGNKAVTATFVRLLVDSELSDSVDSADLRANGAGQDWYESRVQTPSLLTLDIADVGGNLGKKARLSGTSLSTDNAYLTQDFTAAQTGTFSVQWDIYVDSIVDLAGTTPDRSGIMMIGNSNANGPNRADAVRFVFLAFYKNGGGTSGTADLVAMSAFGSFATVASGLNLDQWYTIRVVVNVAAKTYEVYVDGVSKGSFAAVAAWAQSSITYISFAQWNDGAGTFYVDNVHSPALDRYKLAVSTVGSGSVTKSPGESTYTAGSVVTLTATPQAGWAFSSWSGDLTGSVSPVTVTMDSSKAITATFTWNQYTLTVNVAGSGSVTKSPDKTFYDEGDIVSLEAVPSSGWIFDSWSGDLTGGINPTTITMTSNKAVTATFTQLEYTLTITPSPTEGGSVTVSAPESYHYGDTVELNAVPTAEWSFSGWSGDLTGSDNPATIEITKNTAITAHFSQNERTLTINIVGNGHADKVPDKATYPDGTVVQLTASADLGWTFSGWSGGLTGSNNPATLTITGDTTVTATFTQDQYTLTVNVVGAGSVTKTPDQTTYLYGDGVQLNAIPASGWMFSSWSGDLSGSANPATITMDKSKTITATFTGLLADASFDASTNDTLRSNDVGQDWYESRGQNASLLTLDTAGVGGNSGKKARLTGGTNAATDNIYLTQEFVSPQTGVFTVQWDIYIDQILDISSPDRSGWMLIGDDSTSGSGPNAANGERFVYMAFFKNGGGTSGSMDLVAVNRTGSFSSHMIVASGLSLKQWYTIKVVVNVTGGNYDVYVDGVFKATVTSRNAKTSLTHISFAQWNDGAGTFYVDNVLSPAVDTYKLAVNTNGHGSVTVNPGESSYLSGALVSLTPIADSGYVFDHWEVNGVPVGSDVPYFVTMDSSKTVTAFFRTQ